MSKLLNNPVEDELDAIRIKLYEETKNMTTGERVAYIKKRAENAVSKHGYKFVSVDDNGGMRLVRI
jgi:hypothetical protein